MATRRQSDAAEMSEGIGSDYVYPSELIDRIEESEQKLDSNPATALRQNRESAVLRDAEFRRRHVKFDHAEELVDKKSTDTDEAGIPARNRIRRIVEDLKSVILPNVPDATLRADAPLDPDLGDEERRLRQKYRRKTEETANKAVKGILRRSEIDSKMTEIIDDAIIDGVGYAHPKMETLASRRRQARLDSLLQQDDWGPKELRQFERLSRQPHTDYVEAREIFWREGIRSVDDEDMTRVSRARDVDLQWLRDHYNDPEIQPGRNEDNLYLDAIPEQEIGNSDTARAGYIETWQIEEFVAERSSKFLMASGLSAAEAQWSVEYEEAIMVYTAITTNKLLEYRVFTPEELPMELPFVPFYVKTSKRHPYGFSVPLMLELQQKFANQLRAVAAEQAMNSISPNTFAVMLSALGGGDREEIERAAQEGGLAWLEGNDTEDITDIIQQFPNREQGLNNALIQTVRSEEQAMLREGQALSPEMLSGARSAAGKQAIQSAADRPKQYSILTIADGVEKHYERIYKLLQRSVGQEEMLMPLPGDVSVVFNKTERQPVVEKTASGRPLTADSLKSKENPAGVAWRSKEFTKGDLSVPMEARADTRGVWPTGLRAKLRLASAMAEAGVLKSQKTVRERVLDERTRMRDDLNAEMEEGQSQLRQQIRQALQQAQGGDQTGGENAQGGAQPGPATQGGARGSQNPDLAGVEQTGMQQSRPGGGAGAPEDQVGQGRRAPSEEQARREQAV
jgi:hypothetical protein